MVLHCKSIPNQIHHHLIFTFPLPKQCTTINFSPLHLKYPNLQNNPQPPKTQTHNPFLCQIRALHHSNQLTASPSPNPCCPEITHLLTTASPFNSHGEKPKPQPRQSIAALQIHNHPFNNQNKTQLSPCQVAAISRPPSLNLELVPGLNPLSSTIDRCLHYPARR
jgi:hypothetical protein